ncbi:fam126a [Linum grandiflorum]
MDFSNHNKISYSPTSSSSSISSTPQPTTTTTTTTTSSATAANTATSTAATTNDPMHSWWESISRARTRILVLNSILPPDPSSSFSLSSLADSDRPALSFLASPDAYSLFSSALLVPSSGSGSDPLCQWLYETYLSADPHLRLIVLSFVPLLTGIYLSRIHSSESASSPSLAGFEAVLLAIYSTEVKSRAGKPVLAQIPDLSQPSLYHSPRNRQQRPTKSRPSVGVLSAPLEPQLAVKSTKRPIIVGVALDSYFKQISQMPSWSKVELCRYAAVWAGQDCACKNTFDDDEKSSNIFANENGSGYFLEGSNSLMSNSFESNGYGINGVEIEHEDGVVDQIRELKIDRVDSGDLELKGVRIPLPWEILQPLLRILGHCLLGPLSAQDVKDAASVAVRRLYARGSHDLVPQAILATQSLIRLDNRTREAALVAASTSVPSNVTTPSKAKKPEVLLVSK